MRQRSLLRERDVLTLTGAVGVSTAGDWLALIPLVLQAERMATNSGLAVAALFICLWAPIALLAGHVGVLVDRVESTRLLAVVSICQAAVAVGLALVVDELAAVLALTVLLGCGLAVSQAAEFALVPAVAGTRVKEANGLVETSRYAGFTVGPIAGGFLAAATSVEAALLVNAASFVVVGLAALSLRVRRRPARAAGEPGPRLSDGAVSLFRDRLLGLAMAVAFVSLLFMSMSIPADVLYVQDELRMADWGLGAIYSIWTLGMVVGANVVASRIATGALASAAFVAVAVQGLGKAVTPLWAVFGFMCACYAAAGIAHGVKNVAFRTLIHERVPAAAHGRAFAAYNGLRNGAELGALAAGGVLVTAAGAPATLGVAGGIAAVAGSAGLVLLRRAERAPEAPATLAP